MSLTPSLAGFDAMRIYRVVWRLSCAGLGAVGVCVTVLLSPAALAFVFLSSATAAVVLTQVAVRAGRFGGRGRRVSWTITAGLVSGGVAAAFVGLAVALGPGVFLLVALLVLTAPAIVEPYRRWLAGPSGGSRGHLHAMAEALSYAGAASCACLPPVLGTQSLSDQQLARAWNASYLALQAPMSDVERMRVIQERASYLAEFERRNPAGFTTWLTCSATPAGIPLTYLVERRAAFPATDWDGLITGRES